MKARAHRAAQAALPAAPHEQQATTARAPQPALSLHIDRLVLEGFSLGARERVRLQTAIEAELAELMRDGVPHVANGGAVAALAADDFHFERGADVQRLGRAIADSLHRGIAR